MKMYNELPCKIAVETYPRKYTKAWYRNFEGYDYNVIQTDLKALFTSIEPFFDPTPIPKTDPEQDLKPDPKTGKKPEPQPHPRWKTKVDWGIHE